MEAQINDLEKRFNEIIKDIEGRILSDAHMAAVAEIIHAAIDDNFKANGRWDGTTNPGSITIFSGGSRQWTPLADSTVRRYIELGEHNPTEPTLRRSSELIDSIAVHYKGNRITISANKPYAAIHQYGGIINHPGGTSYGYKTEKDASEGKISFLKRGEGYVELGVTKPHQIVIPPRPYITINDEVLESILEVLTAEI